MNIATPRNRLTRCGITLSLVGLLGCGGGGGGTPTGDLICVGEGVIVGGRVTFVKRQYNEQGLTGAQVVKPVRYGKVEIVLEVDGRVVGATYTDANGNYCAAVTGVPPSFPLVYPRVASLTDPEKFKIVVMSDASNLYSRPGASLDGTSPGIYKRDIPIPVTVRLPEGIDHPISGAFNIMDVFVTGSEKAMALSGQAPQTTLFGIWTPGTYFTSGTIGTYFVADDPTNCPPGRECNAYIELSGGDGGGPDAGDHDEFDDDVILHEFGHFMAYAFSKPAEVGGVHYLNDHTQDIRLAWSEGWATFFSAVVRNRATMTNTYGGDPGTANHEFSYSFDIERPYSDLLSSIGTPLKDHGVYTTSEVAVASVLWDVYDGAGDDPLSNELARVWEVVSGFRTASLPSITLDTFGEFTGFARMRETARLRLVEWAPDGYEDGDDTISAETPNGLGVTCHTLFPATDVDYAKFVVPGPSNRTVTIETFNLTNGADTEIHILDANGDPVVQNGVPVRDDNTRTSTRLGQCNLSVRIPDQYLDLAGTQEATHPNNGERYASRVVFNALPGTYFVKIIAGTKPQASRMGGYGLSIEL